MVRQLITRICLAFMLLLSVYPFLWMILSSFKTNREIYNPAQLLPQFFDPFSYRLLFRENLSIFTKFFSVRSVIRGQAILACLVTAAVGFALAKGRFRGKMILTGVSLLVILYPKQAMNLSLFDWMASMEMTGSSYSLLISGVASGLGVLFFTQVFRKIPDELMDLARVEGESLGESFLCFLPLVKPAMITYCILHFFLCWRDHLLPSLILGQNNLLCPWLWQN